MTVRDVIERAAAADRADGLHDVGDEVVDVAGDSIVPDAADRRNPVWQLIEQSAQHVQSAAACASTSAGVTTARATTARAATASVAATGTTAARIAAGAPSRRAARAWVAFRR